MSEIQAKLCEAKARAQNIAVVSGRDPNAGSFNFPHCRRSFHTELAIEAYALERNC